MTIRRWAALLNWIAAWTLAVSHLPVLGGEITASAAKVFFTAAKADEKAATPGPALSTGPSLTPTATSSTAPAALPTIAPVNAPAIDPAAAVPPTLDAAAAPASPNVLRPTPAQQEARVTPSADDGTASGSRSSRRAPASLPLPTLSVPQTASPTLAPPQSESPSTPQTLPSLSSSPVLVADKSAQPQELKAATPEQPVTKSVPATLPALLAPTTDAPKSREPALLPSTAPQQIAAPAEGSVGYDPATGKTYRNMLRGGSSTAVSTPTPAASPVAKPQVIELTPSFQPTSPTAAKPAPAVTAPTTTATTAPPKSQAGAVRSPAAVATDAPSGASGARPNAMLNPSGDEPPSQRAVVSKTPTGPESEKLFESQEPIALTPEQTALKRRVQQTLATYYQNWTLNTREHSPWEVMHAIIAYGVDTKLITNSGQPTTAIGHLCFSGVCNKQQIVTVTRSGRLYMNRGPGVQGHAGQFLAIVAQSQLQRDYPLYAGGKEFTMEDLIKAEQYDCESGTELTFKLIGLMHYLPSDAEWTNFQGQKWSLDRLVREEIVQPVRGAACGGTHRLMGLSYAVRKREQRGEPITGIYKEAEKYIAQYHKYTRGLQNPDGSFSTAWFVRREARLDLDRRLQTTGHVLEWLCFSLNDEQIREPWVTKTVTYVTNLLLDENHEWEIGHLGHALHALQMYNERMYGGPIRSYEGMVSRRPIRTAKQAAPGLNNQ